MITILSRSARIPGLILILTMLSSALMANIRAPFLEAEKQYKNGDLDEFASHLLTLKPSNDEERAFVLYYTALIKTQLNEARTALSQLIDKYPSARYGQLACLELAKGYVLERNIPEAKRFLQKVVLPDLGEKSYWQAVCASEENDWQAAINHADNYLRLSKDKNYLEDAYYIVANGYIGQGKYYSAQTTLNKLKGMEGYPTDLQYFHYLLGYAYELGGAKPEALSNYKQGYELNRHSQLAFQIEDRLFEMKGKYGSGLDITFLYPYTELQIVQDTTEKTGSQESTPSEKPETPKENQGKPLKITERISGKLYLQAGRFSLENNAAGLVKTIRQMSLPASYYEALHNNQTTWVVLSGPFDAREDAVSAQGKLRESGIDCFITSR